MNEAYRNHLELAVSNRKQNKKFFRNLERWKPGKIDKVFHRAHEEAFEHIDCLECANCCKTTSPIFRDVDITRISNHLNIKPVAFIEKYLHLDIDSDYVLNSSPCVFLGEDNKCSIYQHRPKACREYPHTDRKNMHQILGITRKNTEVCPAVSKMVEDIKSTLP